MRNHYISVKKTMNIYPKNNIWSLYINDKKLYLRDKTNILYK